MAWPVAGDDPGRACGAAMLEPNPSRGSNKYLPKCVSFKGNRGVAAAAVVDARHRGALDVEWATA